MADPLSITVGVLAIVGACTTSVKLLRSANAAPQQLARLQTELDHLGDVVRDVEGLALDNGSTSSSLMKNIDDARVKVQQVHDFIHNRLYRTSSSSFPAKVRRRDMIRQSTQLKTFTQDLNEITAHLIDCIAATTLSCTLRISALISTSDNNHQQHATLDIPDSFRSTQPHRQDFELARNIERAQIGLSDSSSAPTNGVDTVHKIETVKEISDAHVAFTERTQRPMFLEDVPFHKHLDQIYRELGENRTQTQHLTLMLDTLVGTRRGQAQRLLRTESVELDKINNTDDTSSSEIFVDVESDGDDRFLDCVSQFSEDHPDGPIERLGTMFLPRQSPESLFEASSAFYPEQYTLDSRFIGAVAVLAVAEQPRTSTHRRQKYFLIYAEGPRTWRRVTVSAIIPSVSQHSALPDIAAPDVSQFYYKTLPGDLESQLKGVLRNKRLLDTVTKVSLTIREDIPGHLVIDASRVRITEDVEETRSSNEEAMLQDIEDIGCPQFLQSEVIVRTRKYSSFFVVQVESRICIEEKMPFVGTGLPDDNGVKNWFKDLKYLSTLRGCDDVVNFIGVVLDDTRKHLKSYLYESPALGNIYSIFMSAETMRDRIPWSIRETWAKQIITAVSHVHAQGLIVGMLQLNSIGVRSDGSAVLTALRPSARRAPNRNSYLPPEIRKVPAYTPLHRIMNFRTDIFQLGLTLWLLAEHRSAVDGLFCLRNACTSVPRYSCQADHTNPVDLPSCSTTGVPKYFDLIISHCRQTDPTARVPARALLQYFHRRVPPPEMADVAKKYPVNDRFVVHCDECQASTTDLHYHCNICYFSDFDLCAQCVSQGIHCFVRDHQLVKRVFRNGVVVNAS